ncbi:MAG: aldehyde dehydrogenase family protein, partial [Polyangiaceae bacterium]
MGQVAEAGATTTTNGHRSSGIQSFEPATGARIGEAPDMSAAEVREAVARARRAQEAWGSLP